jgi:hypothetical protein
MAVLRIAYAASYLLYVAVRGEGILGVGLLLIALIVGLASLILWIIYWAEANSLKNQLMRPLLSPMPMGNPAYLAYGAAPAGYYPPQYAGQPVYQHRGNSLRRCRRNPLSGSPRLLSRCRRN